MSVISYRVLLEKYLVHIKRLERNLWLKGAISHNLSKIKFSTEELQALVDIISNNGELGFDEEITMRILKNEIDKQAKG